MKAPDFAYVRASSIEEALRLKAEHGASARWLAGGQSLLAALAFRLSEPTALIDVSRIESLAGVSLIDGTVRIGAATTHAALGNSAVIRANVPLLADAVPLVAHVAIRNRGTIGGSLAFADPASELCACCVSLDAFLVAVGPDGERRIAARDFFQGLYATSLRDDELLAAVEIPAAKTGQRHAIEEVARRAGDYAMAGVAAVLTVDGKRVSSARLTCFALGDRPVSAAAAEAVLVGRELDEAIIDEAAGAALADIDPSADLNGSAATKKHLASVVVKRALMRILSTGVRVAA